MMLGELHHPPDPSDYDDPQWLLPEDPMDEILSSYSPDRLHDVARAFQLYGRAGHEVSDPAEECDEFRMYEFKVRSCGRGRAHDWTKCPFAHPGEKARRRDPRRHHYTAASCPEFRRGGCQKGDSCEFSHGVFECWLHPARYRTQPCKDGANCTRRVCFFAHTPDQLRVVTPHHSPMNPKESPLAKMLPLLISTGKVSPDDSPPLSPMARSYATSSGSPMSDMIMSLRNLQLERVRSLPRSYNFPGSGYVSPRSPVVRRLGFQSLPSTPTDGGLSQGGYAQCCWETGSDDEPVIERVESGRSLRAMMLEKLSRENSLRRTDANPPPELDWVLDIVN